MDRFLRRVVEQREREQEEAIVRAPLEQFTSRKCRVCDERMRLMEDSRRTVCSSCGGLKRQAQLEQEDRRAEAERAAPAAPPQEPPMPAAKPVQLSLLPDVTP